MAPIPWARAVQEQCVSLGDSSHSKLCLRSAVFPYETTPLGRKPATFRTGSDYEGCRGDAAVLNDSKLTP